MNSSSTNDSLIDKTKVATSRSNYDGDIISSNISVLEYSMKDVDNNNNKNGSTDNEKNNNMDWLYEGCMVHVQARTWPGMNKLGGAARVLKVYDGKQRVDVQYVVMGGTEKSISMTYIKPAPELLTRKKVSLRNRSQLLGRCTRCGSLRADCQSCDWKNQIYTQQQQQQQKIKAPVNTHKKGKKKPIDTNPPLFQVSSSSSSDDSDAFFQKIRRRQKKLLRKKKKNKRGRKKSTTLILSSSSSSSEDNDGDDDAQFILRSKVKDIQQRAYHLYQDNDDYDEFIQPEGTDIILPKDIEDETLTIKNDAEKLKSFFQTKCQHILQSKLPQLQKELEQHVHVSESLYKEWQNLLVASGIDQCRLALKRLEDENIDEEIVHHQFDNQLRDLELHVETFLKKTRNKITDFDDDWSAETHYTHGSSSVNLTDNDVIYNDSDTSNDVTVIDNDDDTNMDTADYNDCDDHSSNYEHNLDKHPHASRIRNNKSGTLLFSQMKRRRNNQPQPKTMQVRRKRRRSRKQSQVHNRNHDDTEHAIQDFLFSSSSSSLPNNDNMQQQKQQRSISDRMQLFLDANTANNDMIHNNHDDGIYSDTESPKTHSSVSQNYTNISNKNTPSSIQKRRRTMKKNKSSRSNGAIHNNQQRTKSKSTKSITSKIDEHDGPVNFSANIIFSLWENDHDKYTDKGHPSNIRNQGFDNDRSVNFIPTAGTMSETTNTIRNDNCQKNSDPLSKNPQLKHSLDQDNMSLLEEDNLDHSSPPQKKNQQEIMNQISYMCQGLLDNFFHPRTCHLSKSLINKLHTTIIQQQHKVDRYAVSTLVFSTILELFQDKEFHTRSLLNLYIEEDEKRLLLYMRLIRFTVQMMTQNLQLFLKKEDGCSFEIFSTNRNTIPLFMECILIQIIDVCYFQALPDAWGVSVTNQLQRLQKVLWKELSTLCDWIAQTIPIVEYVSQIIIEKFPLQQWRRNNTYHNDKKWFVSSIDPLTLQDFWIHGKGFPSLPKGKY